MQNTRSFSRRALSRVEATADLWVCWLCNGRDDISRVLNLSVDGLFLHTTQQGVNVGAPVKLDFLVQEGRLRADAAVRHVQSGTGLGLKFIALPDDDRPRLRALLTRLRSHPTHAAPQPSPR